MPTTSELRKAASQPLRVYRDSSDTTGIVLCGPCRDSFYVLNPSARGAGEYGGQCEHCPREDGERPVGSQRRSRAERVRGHVAAGHDAEQAQQFSRAHQHYLAARMLATAAERPAIQEAMDRVIATAAPWQW